jgi:uncharacterized protein (DUF1684 family)
VERWRQEHEAKLRAADGWLTLIDLIWLKEGLNELDLGVFELRQGKVTYRASSGSAPVEMKPDVPGPPDIRAVGDRRFHVLRRGARYGLRVRDVNHARRREFPALQWFPVKESYRVRARWVAASGTIRIPNVLGDVEERPSPGHAVFTLQGRECRLSPVVDGSELFFIFKDLTSGKETYPAGRFLYTAMPRGNVVELDFNKAENPPCAFTPYATCPLPPPENRLGVGVEAGEKYRH